MSSSNVMKSATQDTLAQQMFYKHGIAQRRARVLGLSVPQKVKGHWQKHGIASSPGPGRPQARRVHIACGPSFVVGPPCGVAVGTSVAPMYPVLRSSLLSASLPVRTQRGAMCQRKTRGIIIRQGGCSVSPSHAWAWHRTQPCSCASGCSVCPSRPPRQWQPLYMRAVCGGLRRSPSASCLGGRRCSPRHALSLRSLWL